jgi:hypothetical protein
MNFNEIFGRSWGTLITLLMAIGFAILIESTVVYGKQYWPAPTYDSFDIVEFFGTAPEDYIVSASKCTRAVRLQMRYCRGRRLLMVSSFVALFPWWRASGVKPRKKTRSWVSHDTVFTTHRLKCNRKSRNNDRNILPIQVHFNR